MAAKSRRGNEGRKPRLPALEASQLKSFYANSFMHAWSSIGGSVKCAPLDDAQLDPFGAQCRRERAVKSHNTATHPVEFGSKKKQSHHTLLGMSSCLLPVSYRMAFQLDACSELEPRSRQSSFVRGVLHALGQDTSDA